MQPRPLKIGILLAVLLPVASCALPDSPNLLADGPVMLDGPATASDLTSGGPKDLAGKPTCMEDSGCSGDMPGPGTDMLVTPAVVYRFWGSSATDVWAVGKGALTMHWNGTSWRRYVNPAKGDLWAVWGTSSSNVWAVGDNATILHWNGTAWTAAAGPPIAGGYNDVWGTSASDAWAVGDNGSIVRWNGTSWSQLSSAYSNGFMAVWAAAPDDAWIGGEAGLILHWDGTSLNEVATGVGDVIKRMRGTSAGSIYALTDNNHYLNWNGTRFTAIMMTADELSVVSDSNIWLVGGSKGGGASMHWNGSTWIGDTVYIYSSATALWATGTDGWLCSSEGRLLPAYRFFPQPASESGVLR